MLYYQHMIYSAYSATKGDSFEMIRVPFTRSTHSKFLIAQTESHAIIFAIFTGAS